MTTALISVSDKTGVLELAGALTKLGIRILSTGGTAKLLADAGIAVTEVADYTGFPEMLDGRVKTLHPKVHAGILARRDLPEHVAAMQREGIDNIDLVVVNLYPFQATIAKPGCTFEDAIENIDIGGPTMVRAAAKNHAHVAIVTDPADYAGIVVTDMRLPDGNGISLVEYIQQSCPHIPVAMITAHGSVETAISALKAGAFDFISKPIELEHLRRLVSSALQLEGDPSRTQDAVDQELIGSAPSIQVLRQQISKLARSQAPIYVSGESGSGKELAARLIHARSARSAAPAERLAFASA